ncbi:hypothetical protein TNCV_398121 [Trichonephila clavipes]|nr:hypothetical protein TNCV_398121 [Trichonephila clavipes]
MDYFYRNDAWCLFKRPTPVNNNNTHPNNNTANKIDSISALAQSVSEGDKIVILSQRTRNVAGMQMEAPSFVQIPGRIGLPLFGGAN